MGNGNYQTFHFGGAFYTVLAVLETLSFNNIKYIHPRSWKSKVGLLLAKKKDSLILAQTKFPELEEIQIKRAKGKVKGQTQKICKGRAEALLIALY